MAGFRVVDHICPGQHVREYPNGTRGQEDGVIRLAIKQYIPLSNSMNSQNSKEKETITIIAGHANGFPKEMYEPLFDELCSLCYRNGISVRGIWFADTSNSGYSGILNENVQGDDTSWLDHSRDLLHMINTFRDEIKRPLVGLAHSMGCTQIVNLSLFHPRLFASLILIEPIIAKRVAPGPHPALFASMRRDLWSSREVARDYLQKARVFRGWDSRVFEKYIEHGLRSLPTALYPSQDANAVTLTTTRHQEMWAYGRPNFEAQDIDAGHDRLLVPDLDADDRRLLTIAPAMHSTLRKLPELRPRVLYIFGKKSPFARQEDVAEMMRLTGIGVGGSGGVAAGKVRCAFMDAGHFLPCERVSECAEEGSKWLVEALQAYRDEEAFLKQYATKKSNGESMLMSSERYVELLRQNTAAERPRTSGPAEKL